MLMHFQPAYAALVVQTRELVYLEMWAGQMACEGLNWMLKELIQEERPNREFIPPDRILQVLLGIGQCRRGELDTPSCYEVWVDSVEDTWGGVVHSHSALLARRIVHLPKHARLVIDARLARLQAYQHLLSLVLPLASTSGLVSQIVFDFPSVHRSFAK